VRTMTKSDPPFGPDPRAHPSRRRLPAGAPTVIENIRIGARVGGESYCGKAAKATVLPLAATQERPQGLN
jgi:hypothetical protein